jgi:hypothetical protein
MSRVRVDNASNFNMRWPRVQTGMLRWSQVATACIWCSPLHFNLSTKSSTLVSMPPNYFSKLVNSFLIQKTEKSRGPCLKPLLLTILTPLLSDCLYKKGGREKPKKLLAKLCSFSFKSPMTFHFHIYAILSLKTLKYITERNSKVLNV